MFNFTFCVRVVKIPTEIFTYGNSILLPAGNEIMFCSVETITGYEIGFTWSMKYCTLWILFITRMHSSRMCTARSSSRLLGGLPQCMLGYPPGVGLETPLCVGLETPGCGPGDPPRPDPSTSPCVWAWNPPPPWPDSSTSHLGVGLENCKAC